MLEQIREKRFRVVIVHCLAGNGSCDIAVLRQLTQALQLGLVHGGGIRDSGIILIGFGGQSNLIGLQILQKDQVMLLESVKELVVELKHIQLDGTFPENIDGMPIIPGMIDAGNGQGFLISRKIERLIKKISTELKGNDTDLLRSHTDKEWNKIVRDAFGPPLARIDLDDDIDGNAQAVLEAVEETIRNQQTVEECREFAFGCTLFGNSDIAPFDIGAVKFEPRKTWLERKKTEGYVSQVSAKRIERIWRGDKVRKRTEMIDNLFEGSIQDAIGNCPFVCSVRTKGLAAEAGEQKALLAARLAITSIALRWRTPSKSLEGFNLLIDRSVRKQRVLTFVPGRINIAGNKLQNMPFGPSISSQEWVEKMNVHKDEYKVISEIIEFCLSASGSIKRPNMISTLLQALIWFHEGCREQVDFIAVVKFAACMDTLAGGKKSGGIRQLIKARLGMNEGDQIRTNGQSVKQAVEEIYGQGRSRAIHGSSDDLGYDQSSRRMFSEYLSRLCLVACLDWAGNNLSDNPQDLVK